MYLHEYWCKYITLIKKYIYTSIGVSIQRFIYENRNRKTRIKYNKGTIFNTEPGVWSNNGAIYNTGKIYNNALVSIGGTIDNNKGVCVPLMEAEGKSRGGVVLALYKMTMMVKNIRS